MIKTKKEILFGILFFSLLMSIFSVSAVYTANGVTFLSPTASSTISGTKVLNVTNATFDEMVNCTFYAKSSLTANSSWTLIKSSTANNTIYNVNATFSSAILEDANNYQFNATCRNSTNDITDRVITGVIVDNTVPVAPTLSSPSETDVISTAGAQTFSFSVTNARTTSCTYQSYRAGSSSDSKSASGSGTYSAGTCSFTQTFSDTTDNGLYYVNAIASDETNTTSSATYTFNVAFAGNHGGGKTSCPSGSTLSNGKCIAQPAGFLGLENNSTTLWIVGIILVVIFVIVLYFIFFRN